MLITFKIVMNQEFSFVIRTESRLYNINFIAKTINKYKIILQKNYTVYILKRFLCNLRLFTLLLHERKFNFLYLLFQCYTFNL